jgi:hypothetical protein
MTGRWQGPWIRQRGWILVAVLAAGIPFHLAGCGDNGPGDNPDAAVDAGGLDAGSDAGDPDAMVADAAPDAAPLEWELKAQESGQLIAVSTSGVAVLDDVYPLYWVYTSDTGTDFNVAEVTVFSHTPQSDHGGWPMGLAYDPLNPSQLVAALGVYQYSTNTLVDLAYAWSVSGSFPFDFSLTPFSTPWPAQNMRFVGGAASEVVWRADNRFYYSNTLGETYPRMEELTLPATCDQILGFDMPADDHDTVAIWCFNGDGQTCDVTTSVCQPIPTVPNVGISYVTYAPSNPSRMYISTDCDCGYGLFVSDDGGASSSQVYSVETYLMKVAPADDGRICAMAFSDRILHCSADDGQTWRLLTPTLGSNNLILDFTFDDQGGIWAVGNAVIYFPPL